MTYKTFVRKMNDGRKADPESSNKTPHDLENRGLREQKSQDEEHAGSL